MGCASSISTPAEAPAPATEAGSGAAAPAGAKDGESGGTPTPTHMLLTSAEAHFHPFQVGAPRPEEAHKAIDAFCAKFAAGLADPTGGALLNLFAEGGSWADPVGGPPPYVGKEALAARIEKLPPMDYAKVVEVFYTVNDKIFLCKTEVKFKDKPHSFFILDKFVATQLM